MTSEAPGFLQGRIRGFFESDCLNTVHREVGNWKDRRDCGWSEGCDEETRMAEKRWTECLRLDKEEMKVRTVMGKGVPEGQDHLQRICFVMTGLSSSPPSTILLYKSGTT